MISIKLTGFLFVLTLPFTAVGVWLGSQALKPLLEWQATRAWTAVPADILATNLEVYVSDDGGETYRARAI